MKALLAALLVLIPATGFGQRTAANAPDSVLGKLGIGLDRPHEVVAQIDKLTQGSEPPPIRNVGEAAAVVGHVVERLKHNRFQIPEFHVSVNDSKEINAYAQADLKQITIPIGIVRFLRADEGELAFVIAHEIGHIQDRQCHEIAEHARITQEGQSRLCEQRADALGLQYLVGAGYNPYDAAAFFGRLLMYGGGATVLDTLLGRMASDHPVDLDRINNLRKVQKALLD